MVTEDRPSDLSCTKGSGGSGLVAAVSYNDHWYRCNSSFVEKLEWLVDQVNSIDDGCPLEENLHHTAV